MKTFALDFGNTIGWAIRSSPAIVSAGSEIFAKRGESEGMRFVRFVRFLDRMFADCSFGLIAYEQVIGISPRPGQAGQHQTYGAYKSHMMVWADGKGVNYTGVPVPSIKKFATDNGNCNKDKMVAKMIELAPSYGIPYAEACKLDHNACDAFHLLRFVEECEDF